MYFVLMSNPDPMAGGSAYMYCASFKSDDEAFDYIQERYEEVTKEEAEWMSFVVARKIFG